LRLLVFLLKQKEFHDKRKRFVVEKVYLITSHFCKNNTVFQSILTAFTVSVLIIYFAAFLFSFNKRFSEIIEDKNENVNFFEVVLIQECRK
jgi:hypothetical protein